MKRELADAPTFVFETTARHCDEAAWFTLRLQDEGFAVRSTKVFDDCYLLEYWS